LVWSAPEEAPRASEAAAAAASVADVE